jgi:hypothetical protein
MPDLSKEIAILRRLLEAQQIATMTAVRKAERFEAELAAVRIELTDAITLSNQRLDCWRTERWELANVMRERDELRELLIEARHEWLGSCQIGSARAALKLDVFMSRIDEALNKGGTDD